MKATNKYKKWTEEETDILVEHYEKHKVIRKTDLAKYAKQFKRTYYALVIRANRLGLRSANKKQYLRPTPETIIKAAKEQFLNQKTRQQVIAKYGFYLYINKDTYSAHNEALQRETI